MCGRGVKPPRAAKMGSRRMTAPDRCRPNRIQDYALIGDTHSAALVGRDGSMDWLCLPRFDSGACFAALLGDRSHGRWLLAPAGGIRSVSRQYRKDSLVLETEFTTASGVVRVIDCMPPRQDEPDVVRVVEGVSGEVEIEMELIIRFDYGRTVPWVRQIDGHLGAIAGPDALAFWSSVPTFGKDFTTRAEFTVKQGQRVPFVLMWHPSHLPAPKPIDAIAAADDTTAWWRDWVAKSGYDGRWRDQVVRSLITLKALTYAPTGGMVAAPTTSLPERLGGVRNWDYRYCWLRDATYTLYALMIGGYTEEAAAWRNWLLRAVAGDPATLQTMYGVAGERRLPELELDWLPGYQHSRPVRIGNAAVNQMQLDVYGEVLDALHVARRRGMPLDDDAWSLERTLLSYLEHAWREPDEGIWEVRGPRRHFTHSKAMVWVAFDRAIKACERFKLEGPVDEWRRTRTEIQQQVFEQGFDAQRNTFTQYYGSHEPDGSLLLLPLVGFVSPTDPRMIGTVKAIEEDLLVNGFVQRYCTREHVDGLPPGEGAFLACTFWLADNYTLQGRRDEAERLFERLLGLCNDVGLLAEQYDPDKRLQLGNFPQAFSHVMLINSACNLSGGAGPAQERRK
jgi:GH15 family glucan-1,4-alpha-glucosidase